MKCENNRKSRPTIYEPQTWSAEVFSSPPTLTFIPYLSFHCGFFTTNGAKSSKTPQVGLFQRGFCPDLEFLEVNTKLDSKDCELPVCIQALQAACPKLKVRTKSIWYFLPFVYLADSFATLIVLFIFICCYFGAWEGRKDVNHQFAAILCA